MCGHSRDRQQIILVEADCEARLAVNREIWPHTPEQNINMSIHEGARDVMSQIVEP